jgi:hypothetical protein
VGVALAVVSTLRSPRRLTTAEDVAGFKQELVDRRIEERAADHPVP